MACRSAYIQRFVEAEYAKHGLDKFGWTVKFDRKSRRGAECNKKKKLISVSRTYVETSTVTTDELEQVSLEDLTI